MSFLSIANEKEKKEYAAYAKKHGEKKPIWKHCWHAFVAGGLICLIGQFLQVFFITYFDFTKDTAGNPTVAVLIFVSVILTGIGVYDKLAQWAGGGTAVPITGFANSMASSALEYRTEGLVLGVGSNMFKLAGSVICFGVVSAFIIAIIKVLLKIYVGIDF